MSAETEAPTPSQPEGHHDGQGEIPLSETLSDAAVWDMIQRREPSAAMLVRLTDEALAAALGMQRDEPAYAGLPLRVYIEGKGCDGFYYGVSFDERRAEDLVFSADGLEIVVDPESLRFLYGSLVTWVDDERGRGFLVENPNHRRFRGKFYKRRSWQDLLTQSPQTSPQ